MWPLAVISEAGIVVVLIFNITKPIDDFDLSVSIFHWTQGDK